MYADRRPYGDYEPHFVFLFNKNVFAMVMEIVKTVEKDHTWEISAHGTLY